MIIVSSDETMIINMENIEAIGIGNPLENNEGKFQILANTSSDNQYIIARYKTEESAKEVLKEISFAYECNNNRRATIGEIASLTGDYEYGVYKMPEN